MRALQFIDVNKSSNPGKQLWLQIFHVADFKYVYDTFHILHIILIAF